MKSVICIITFFLLFNYSNAVSTCLTKEGWAEKFKYEYGTVVDGGRCHEWHCDKDLLACDVTGNGKRLTCKCLRELRLGITGGEWVKRGTCSENDKGEWCT
ncbi:hypothetical protein BJ944DRAFT_270144 [Cunninghamella echinulata]|nr:hypothetical protein BJ944DRAFT_270144 [Cunninghamella echinulata]